MSFHLIRASQPFHSILNFTTQHLSTFRKTNYPMANTSPRRSPGACPEVLIVGAGLGGLTLGLLLEEAGIPYRILERASRVKPLGKLDSRVNQNPVLRSGWSVVVS